MNHHKYKYIIIGGGLSGLSAALQFTLQGEEDFIVLEARDRVGGRVLTEDRIDLGAAWIHNHHQTVLRLAQHLGVETFEQHTAGFSMYVTDSEIPAQLFEVEKNEPPSYRLKGGTGSLIKALYQKLSAKIQLKVEVQQLSEVDDAIQVTTTERVYTAAKVILTLPPRLASTLNFVPKLPELLITEMQSTHTWFSHAIKVGIAYKEPFWRLANQSGMLFDQFGDVIEIHDHTNHNQSQFSLMGFANERLRGVPFEEQKTIILKDLAKHFGQKVYNYTDFKLLDWSKEQFTTGLLGLVHPRKTNYGNPVFQEAYFNSKLYFAGTETSAHQGGFMEGAVYSGLKTAQELLKQ